MAKDIRIKKNTKLGSLEAETDEMLSECFIDNGDIDELVDCSSVSSVVLGRTGVGKTALIVRIHEITESYSIKLDPSELAFRYIENSNIINFLEDLDVNLDLFYRLLWRHVLTIELLRLKFDTDNQRGKFFTWWDSLSILENNESKKIAKEYFKRWGNEFWLSTDTPIKEITNNLAQNIDAGIKGATGPLEFNASTSKNLSNEVRFEVQERAKKVVSELQIQELTRVLSYLATDLFNDTQKKYIILIDQLDENWTDKVTRFKLIRALIEEIKSFKKIKNVKIIVSMRDDLLDLVIREAMNDGFQLEKFESYILRVKWTENSLKELIDKRMQSVFERKYTKQNVSFSDIFPADEKRNINSFQYLLARTFRRPRDLLQFINICLENAVDNVGVSWSVIYQSEIQYSEKRKDNLLVEWQGFYPSLKYFLPLLYKQRSSINVGELFLNYENRVYDELYTPVINQNFSDPLSKSVLKAFEDENILDLKKEVILCFYRIGVIGVKLGTTEKFIWSYLNKPTLSVSEIANVTKVRVHKMFWKSFSIVDVSSES